MLLARMRGMFSRRHEDNEFSDELREHLDLLTEENVRRGMPLTEARREAKIRLGGTAQLRETHHELTGVPFLETLFQDIRYALRMLRRSPGFTAVAVLTLALGIGANTAIFSAVYGILLKPLPYHDASRLVELSSRRFSNGVSLYDGVSDAAVKNISAQCPAIGQIAEFETQSYTLTGQLAPELLSSAEVSGNFFSVLGVHPLLGRPILPSDIAANNNHVVVLSYDVWKALLGSDPNSIGKKLTLDGNEYTIVGVMPREFTYGSGERGLWVPRPKIADDTDRASREAQVVARLRSGAVLGQVQSQLKVLSARLSAAYPKTDGGWDISAGAMKQDQIDTGDLGPSLLLQLLGAVGLVLLIACVNVSALLLARGCVRQKEVAIRQALGATRLRIVRQFLCESVLLALVGGAFGLVFSIGGIGLERAVAPPNTPRLANVQLDANVFWFTLGISVLAGIFFGLAPALQVSTRRTGATFAESLTQSLAGFSEWLPKKLRGALVIVEVALAVVLVIGAALVTRSFQNWLAVDWGFRTDHVLTMSVNYSKAVCNQASKEEDAHTECLLAVQDILRRVQSVPGIEKIAASSSIPMVSDNIVMTSTVQGQTQKLGFSNGVPLFKRIITPEYFDAVGVKFVGGRDFTSADSQGAPPVVIVNQTFAAKFLSGHALGKQISEGNSKNGQPQWMTVIGEVRDTQVFGPNAPYFPEFFKPFAQSSEKMAGNLIVRTAADPMSMAAAVEHQVWAVDKNAPVTKLKTMDQIVAEQYAEPRFQAILLGSFGALGLILAMVGVYGVISYGVVQRTREIGIRMALGAQQGRVLRTILREGMLLASAGIALGVGGALAMNRVLESLVFEISPTDLTTFLGVTIVLVLVALLACYIPARRAMKVDPMVALRYE